MDTFDEREVISEKLEKHMRMNKRTGKNKRLNNLEKHLFLGLWKCH
jgi:hypothetical protein